VQFQPYWQGSTLTCAGQFSPCCFEDDRVIEMPTRRQLLTLGAVLSAAASIRPGLARSLPREAIDVRDFGARGDGFADDTRAIQAAIDHALEARKVTVHIPAGRYRTTDTLHLGYNANFTTVALIGEGAPSYAGHSGGAIILPEQTDRPALNIQGARKSVVRNICIVGRNFQYGLEKSKTNAGRRGNYLGVADPEVANWLDPSLRDGLRPFAPYAAITIDAHAAPPRSDGYPPPPAASEMPVIRRYSSDVEISNCWLGGFAVCIAVQPCDADGNGDFVRIAGTTFFSSAYGVAVCNSQSRNVAIRDCTYTYLHTFVTNRHFGRGIGMMGGPIENVAGNASYQMFDLLAARAGPVVVSSAYFEAQCRIGVWSNNSSFNATIEFQSCQFNLDEGLLGASTGAMLECGTRGAVRFSGCTFHLARRIFHPVRGAGRVDISSCMIGQVSDYRDPGFYTTIPPWLARTLEYTCGGVFMHGEALRGAVSFEGTTGLAFGLASGNVETRERGSTVAVEAGRRAVVHHYADAILDRNGARWHIRWRPRPLAIDKRPGTGPLRSLSYQAPDELALELDLRAGRGRAHKLEPGDVLYDPASATVLAVSTVLRDGDICFVRALQLNNLRVESSRVAASVDVTKTGGYLWRYDANVMVGDRVLFGDFTAGSPVVRNVHDGDGNAEGIGACLVPGDWLSFVPSGPPLAGHDRPQPYGADVRIEEVEQNAGTVRLDRRATSTARYLVSTIALG
jgi:hypothetical protein